MSEGIIAIILGIVEGLTEFLPISSTGHLILVNQFAQFKDTEFSKTFDVIIQLGAILSVVVYFWKRIFPFQPGLSKENRNHIWEIWFKAIVGVIPALIIGFLAADYIEEKLFNPYTVAIALLIGGIILVFIESRKHNSKINSIGELSYFHVLAIGFFQCIAMIPGTSRSAATIIGAMLIGASRIVAAEFSFFLAIPTMVAASGYSLMKGGLHLSSMQYLLLGIGFIVAFGIAWLVIASFMKFITRHNFKIFGWYRIALGVIVLAYFTFLT